MEREGRTFFRKSRVVQRWKSCSLRATEQPSKKGTCSKALGATLNTVSERLYDSLEAIWHLFWMKHMVIHVFSYYCPSKVGVQQVLGQVSEPLQSLVGTKDA